MEERPSDAMNSANGDGGGETQNDPPNPEESIPGYIRKAVVGANVDFVGPFGRKGVSTENCWALRPKSLCKSQAFYCDYCDGGRKLPFIEDYLSKEVSPVLGDIASTTTVGSLQTAMFMDEVRLGQVVQFGFMSQNPTYVWFPTIHQEHNFLRYQCHYRGRGHPLRPNSQIRF